MGMRAYIIRRLLLLIPTIIGVTLLIFSVVQVLSPEQRAALYITSEQQADDIDAIIEKYHLRDPVYIQYFVWITQVLQGNLGYNVKSPSGRVLQNIINRAPATIELTIIAAPVIILSGIALGVTSAVHRDKLIDHVTRVTSIIGWSFPSFWLGILLLAIFYAALGWVGPGRLNPDASVFIITPPFTRYTKLNTIDGLLNGQLWITVDALKHLILPVASLTVQSIALIVRVMRSSMLEALTKGYIVSARAKGLGQKEVINKHARRNALIPVVTLAGMLSAGLLTGVVITETIFSIPGLGSYAAHMALPPPDIAGVLGFTLFTGVLFVIVNLIVDVAYAYIDPRIRLG
ncbi:MAG: ABC transporter permease [Candidatus Bathyarchaeota archaeon]|nr:ABC transporter permease [Candidatus Bathyarchaeota archaeon]